MSEKTMLVCDVCGKPAEQTVTIKSGLRSLWKDLCSTHLAELLRGTRTPRRGRPRGSSAGAAKAAPRKTASTRSRAGARRRGRAKEASAKA